MHEYPITRRIIEIAEEYARKNGADDVKVIHLVVGDYSGYESSSIELYFELIAENSLCRNARLEIDRIIPKLKCSRCGEYFVRKPFSFECPYCQGEGIPTTIGQEFYVRSIEV